MVPFKCTAYFENEVLKKRPYLKIERRIRVIEDPVKVEKQEDNRYRFWRQISELDNKYLRVITSACFSHEEIYLSARRR